jgi:hypothetical protein
MVSPLRKTCNRAASGRDHALDILADVTREIAVDAASISGQLKLVMAGSLILAITRLYSAVLRTQGATFEGLEGV